MSSTEDLLAIDELALDREWLQQPRLYYQFARKLAKARKNLEYLRANTSLVKAEVARDVRANPENYEVEGRITNENVAQTVESDDDVKAAINAEIEGKHKVDVLQAAIVALDHRKKALENMVHLYAMNYYSTPRPPEGAEKEIEEKVKKAVRGRGRNKKRQK